MRSRNDHRHRILPRPPSPPEDLTTCPNGSYQSPEPPAQTVADGSGTTRRERLRLHVDEDGVEAGGSRRVRHPQHRRKVVPLLATVLALLATGYSTTAQTSGIG